MILRRFRRVTGLAAASLSVASVSFGAENQLEEIVVTATQREQSLQQVPLAVTALSQTFLEQHHLNAFSDLALFTPGFVSAPNYGYIRNSSMRGISNNQFGFADDPSIAMYVDGVYQGRGGTGMQVNALYDVDRVEIIKGPQATLFGRSSIGGAISILTNQPGKEFQGSTDLGFGERGRVQLRGAVNLPVSETLGLRLAADVEHQDGYIKNLNGGDRLQAQDIRAARLTTRYSGFDNVTATLKIGYERRKQGGSIYQAVGLPEFSTESTLVGHQSFANFSIYDVAGTLKVDFNPQLSLTSQTSWRRVQNEYVEDYDALAAVVGGPYFQQSNDRLFQQDLRLNFDDGNRGTLVAGLSYFHEKLDAAVSNWVDGNPTFTGFAFTGVPTPGLLPGDYSNAFNEAGNLYGTFHGYSAFIDGSIPLGSSWSLDAGVRYNSDTKDYTQDLPNPAVAAVNAGKIFAGAYYNWGYWTSQPISSKKTWTDTAGRAALSWLISDEATAYLSWSQGWKAGGIDSFKIEWPNGIVPPGFFLFFGQDAAALGAKPAVYNPEKSTSIELGIKGKLLDRRFGYNIALYDYRYRDLQVSVQQGGSSIIQNIGKAKGHGAEIELRYLPDASWDLFANAAYNFTEITQFGNKPEQVGQPLNQAPKYNAAVGASYSFAAPVSDGKVTLSASSNFRDKMRTDNALIEGVKSYVLTNLRATYSSGSGRFSASLYADNVFDRFNYGRYSSATPFLFPVASYSVLGYPRTVGIDFHAGW